MIHTLSGSITAVHENNITVQVTGSGIGFAVCVPHETQFTLGKEVKLFTHLYWNQEQGPTLYGFISPTERTIFLFIIGCSGIGPKIALATLETMSPGTFVQAIAQEDSKTISNIPGIGKKKAEQIIVHLKHKIARLIDTGIDLGETDITKHWKQLGDVLTSLNYSRQEIARALQHTKQHSEKNPSFDGVLRKALSFLSKLR